MPKDHEGFYTHSVPEQGQEERSVNPAAPTPAAEPITRESTLRKAVSKLIVAEPFGLTDNQKALIQDLASQVEEMDPETAQTFQQHFGHRIKQQPQQTEQEQQKQNDLNIIAEYEATYDDSLGRNSTVCAAQEKNYPVLMAMFRQEPKKITDSIARTALMNFDAPVVEEMYAIRPEIFQQRSMMLDACTCGFSDIADKIAHKNPDFVTPKNLTYMAQQGFDPKLAHKLSQEFEVSSPELEKELAQSLQEIEKEEEQQKFKETIAQAPEFQEIPEIPHPQPAAQTPTPEPIQQAVSQPPVPPTPEVQQEPEPEVDYSKVHEAAYSETMPEIDLDELETQHTPAIEPQAEIPDPAPAPTPAPKKDHPSAIQRGQWVHVAGANTVYRVFKPTQHAIEAAQTPTPQTQNPPAPAKEAPAPTQPQEVDYSNLDAISAQETVYVEEEPEKEQETAPFHEMDPDKIAEIAAQEYVYFIDEEEQEQLLNKENKEKEPTPER